jgi:hypothetical protein
MVSFQFSFLEVVERPANHADVGVYCQPRCCRMVTLKGSKPFKFFLTVARNQNHKYITIKIDEFAKSQKSLVSVIPAKAGIQGNQSLLDSRVRGSDDLRDFLRDHQNWELILSQDFIRIEFILGHGR